MKWNVVKTQDDIDFLLKKFNNFHDSCIASMKYKSGAYVDRSSYSMNPINTERTLSVTFQSQFKDCYSIEIIFDKLIKLNLEPSDENYDCIINDVTLKKIDNLFLWVDSLGVCNTPKQGTWIMSRELMWRVCK